MLLIICAKDKKKSLRSVYHSCLVAQVILNFFLPRKHNYTEIEFKIYSLPLKSTMKIKSRECLNFYTVLKMTVILSNFRNHNSGFINGRNVRNILIGSLY